MSRYVVVKLSSDDDGLAWVVATVAGFSNREEARDYATNRENSDFSYYYDVVDTEERES